MEFLLSFLTNRLTGFAAIGLSVVLGLTLVVDTVKIHNRDHTITVVTAAKKQYYDDIVTPVTGWRDQLKTCTTSKNSLLTALDDQSKSINALKAASDASSAAATRRVAAAQQAVNTATTNSIRILSTPPGDDAVSSALSLVRGGQ